LCTDVWISPQAPTRRVTARTAQKLLDLYGVIGRSQADRMP
jgi:hypothetical protein